MFRILKRILLCVLLLVVGLYALAYATTYHPAAIETVPVTGEGGRKLSRKAPLKVLSWNIQYLAGKDYVFYYDLPDNSGPDSRPSPEAIARTLDEVVRIVREENPDVLLLQEVDRGSKHTDYEDQLALIQSRLPEYGYSATTFYHKAVYVPHPMILGSVGMTLGVLSKYPMESATRYELPTMPNDWLTRLFYFHRCVLECRLPLEEGGHISLMDTHLDAFAQGSDTMQKQVELIRTLLEKLDAEGTPWVIAGDFNLLPQGQRQYLSPARQASYGEDSELTLLTTKWASFPNPALCISEGREAYFTHFPNDPAIKGPDRTIDYAFHSALLTQEQGLVRQKDTLAISDHLPVLVSYRFRQQD